jgi:hypothetical protein
VGLNGTNSWQAGSAGKLQPGSMLAMFLLASQACSVNEVKVLPDDTDNFGVFHISSTEIGSFENSASEVGIL